jgi:hypothetical protein
MRKAERKTANNLSMARPQISLDEEAAGERLEQLNSR